ncbi:MAG: hypothetical protein DI563_24340 [Variovorax paradoxus]|uniref:Uncharacterized protein n=1 Tax=Variovorax paradoxus TaxID=34073 RepID=A0A2W5PN62_VARPD|nr:MAG: hypothetical protein DI563_24340 [Variovorax paradoxus]
MQETSTPGIGPRFAQWAELTDAYARKLTALQQGEPGAGVEAARLAREIQALMAPPGTVPTAPPRPSGA